MPGYSRRPERDDTDVIGARILAQFLDTIMTVVVGAVGVGLFWVLAMPFGATEEGQGIAATLVFIGWGVGPIAALGYWFLLEGIWDGYTIGKRVFGIKVVKENGDPCSIGGAILRNLLEIIDGFGYYLVGIIVMAFTDRRQRIGDLLAGTVVVRDDDTGQPAREDAEPGGG